MVSETGGASPTGGLLYRPISGCLDTIDSSG